jgi:hypothetical protein
MMEEERILAEVAKRRERAKELGLFSLLPLFRDHLEFLKDGSNPERLPNTVTDVKVTDIESGRDSVHMREICFAENSYAFIFKCHDGVDPSGDSYITGHLLLNKEGQTLLDLYCLGEDQEWVGRVWKPFRVDAFIEGPWVQEVKNFEQGVVSLSDQRQAQSQAERTKKELEDLKNKFGLS